MPINEQVIWRLTLQVLKMRCLYYCNRVAFMEGVYVLGV